MDINTDHVFGRSQACGRYKPGFNEPFCRPPRKECPVMVQVLQLYLPVDYIAFNLHYNSFTLLQVLSTPFRSLQFQCHEVVTVRALQLNRITLPPRETAAELEGGKAGENIVIKKSAQPAGVMATDLKGITRPVTGTAFPFHADDSSDNLFAYPGVCSHFYDPPLLVCKDA